MSATHADLARLLETLASRSPHAHLIVGPDGIVEFANVSASILLATDSDAIVGTPISRWAPELRSERDDPASGIELDVLTAQSDKIPVEVAITPLDDAESRSWVVMHDITRRRGLEGSVRSHAEELERIVASRARSLSGMHQKLRTLYDMAPMLDFTIDSQGAIASANRKAFLSLGVAIEKLIGVPLCEVVLPDRRQALQLALEAAQAGATTPFETKLRSADGSVLDVLFHPTPEEGGARGSLRLLGLDVTARREAEKLVDQGLDLAEAQRARMERILRGIAEGIVVTDADGQVRLMNAIAESLLGIEERWAFGRDLFADQRDARFVEAWTAFVAGNDDVLRAELACEGDARTLAAAISRIRTAEGRSAGAVVVLRDATSQREADQKNRELMLEVAQMLRTSMGSIRGFTGALVRDENAPIATTRRYLGLLAKEANRVHRTIEHLLSLARLDAGRDALKVDEGSILKVLRDVEASFAPGARARGIRFTLHASDPDGTGRFDADKVRRILDHLVAGSMKRTPTAGEVRVELRRDDGKFHLEVRDTGTTSAQDELDLGTVLVRRLVELHKGEITTESVPGTGTIARFWIPGNPEAKPAAPAAASSALTDAALSPSAGAAGASGSAGHSFPDALVDDPEDEAALTLLEKTPIEEV